MQQTGACNGQGRIQGYWGGVQRAEAYSGLLERVNLVQRRTQGTQKGGTTDRGALRGYKPWSVCPITCIFVPTLVPLTHPKSLNPTPLPLSIAPFQYPFPCAQCPFQTSSECASSCCTPFLNPMSAPLPIAPLLHILEYAPAHYNLG